MTAEIQDMSFTSDQRCTLLLIVRRAIEAVVCGKQPRDFVTDDPKLDAAHCGAFVTIKSKGQLRGCIGRFIGDQTLPQLVANVAVSAATQDPRFADNPLQPSELCECHIEISVLSPLEKIANPMDFRIGVHGIYVRAGNRTGCFLPQVAPEAGWNAEQFLSQCCARKAGLSADAWRTGECEVFRFTTEIIEEPHLREAQQVSFGSFVVQTN